MKTLFFSVLTSLVSVVAFGQDIYKVADLSTVDLNGTARYVGMGGAMSALGGDLSTMSSNPAAIGLYRSSDVAATMSIVTQPGGEKFDGNSKTHASFDQLGFVYSCPLNDEGLRFVNFGLNYHKQHDFNQLSASQNRSMVDYGLASQTWQLSDLCNYWGSSIKATPLAAMAYQCFLLSGAEDDYSAYGSSAHFYNKATWGSNQALDFNISANINDQLYLGFTATGYNVYNKSSMLYSEDLITFNGIADGYYNLTNYGSLKGNAFDAKFGVLVRPVVGSNFKIGLTLATPTYYDLTYRNESWMRTYDNQFGNNSIRYRDDYDYKVRTPWRLGVSVGNTFFNRLALDAEYEFADYSACSVSYGDDYDDWFGSKDKALNKQIDKYLKCTHTLKVGAELMVNRNVFVRGGYNFVSAAFDKEAYLNQYINSASVDATTYTDYMNLSAINRFTCGLGFKFGSFYADLACQFQNQHGDLYAFSVTTKEPFDDVPTSRNVCPSKRVKLNKTQFMLTMGYRF